MLQVLYIALVATPLTIAAASLAVAIFRSRAVVAEKPAPVPAQPDPLTAMGRRALAPAPPTAGAPSDVSSLVAALSLAGREARASVAAPASAPAARIGAPPAETKRCPDCAEEILAAARVCKHCRCRFDEPADGRRALSA